MELPEEFEEGVLICDYYGGSNKFTEMYLDPSGLIFNFGSNGRVSRLNPDYSWNTLVYNSHEVLDNFGNTLFTEPSNAITRYQVIDSVNRKLIITKELDYDYYLGDCYDPEFEVIDFIGDEYVFSRKKLRLGNSNSDPFFPVWDVIFDKQSKYYIYSVGDYNAFCTVPDEVSGLHFVSLSEDTGEIEYLQSEITDVEFIETQSTEIFFFGEENDINSIYRLNPDLTTELVVEDLFKRRLYKYGDDEMIFITTTGFKIYDNQFTQLLAEVDFPNTSFANKFNTLGKDIYRYHLGKLFLIDENFVEQLLYDEGVTSGIPSITGIIPNGDYTYLYGMISNGANYSIAVDENLETLRCEPIDECTNFRIEQVDPICMGKEYTYVRVLFEPVNEHFYNLYLKAKLKALNYDTLNIESFKYELINYNFSELSPEFSTIYEFDNFPIDSSTTLKTTVDLSFRTLGIVNPQFSPQSDFDMYYGTLDDDIGIKIIEANGLKVCEEDEVLFSSEFLLDYLSDDCYDFLASVDSKDESLNYSIVPNPASHFIQILNLQKEETYTLMNVYGQTILRGELTKHENTISVNHLNSGMYFLNVGDRVLKFWKGG